MIAEVQRLQRQAITNSSTLATPATLMDDTRVQWDSVALSQEPDGAINGLHSLTTTIAPVLIATSTTIQEQILQPIEGHKIEVSIKDLMGILQALTTNIHDRMFPQQLQPPGLPGRPIF